MKITMIALTLAIAVGSVCLGLLGGGAAQAGPALATSVVDNNKCTDPRRCGVR